MYTNTSFKNEKLQYHLLRDHKKQPQSHQCTVRIVQLVAFVMDLFSGSVVSNWACEAAGQTVK